MSNEAGEIFYSKVIVPMAMFAFVSFVIIISVVLIIGFLIGSHV